MKHRLSVGAAVLSLWLAGCAPAAAPASLTADVAEPRVYFVEPADASTVSSPVKVVMAADNFVVEPAGETVTDGHGHLHITVDADCVAPGQGVPKDETHLHYGQGQMEAELELAAGEHTLCLQAADGLHVALAGDGMTQTISVVVE